LTLFASVEIYLSSISCWLALSESGHGFHPKTSFVNSFAQAHKIIGAENAINDTILKKYLMVFIWFNYME
jgi:hypothetical protein